MKEKKLILMNGRFKDRQHIYIAAHSKADAGRILTELSGGNSRGVMNEINVYFSIGYWGNSMEGVKPERGAWISNGTYPEKPRRAKLRNAVTCV